MKPSRGFSLVEILIFAAVIVLVGLISYNLYSMQQARNKSLTEQQSTAAAIPAAPPVNSTEDLDKAASVLDSIELDANAGDTSKLDAEAAF